MAKSAAQKYTEKNVVTVTREMEKKSVFELKQLVSMMMGLDAAKKCLTKEALVTLAATATCGLDKMTIRGLKHYVAILMGPEAVKKCLTREDLVTMAKRLASKYAEKKGAAAT